MPDSMFYSGRGDDGLTGLLGPERVHKYDPRPAAYGTVDEAQAALGLVRASDCSPRTGEMVLTVQRTLYTLMAELASGDPEGPFAGSILPAHVDQLEAWIAELEDQVDFPKEFVIPGDSRAGAALHLSRTVVRRAERLAVQLADQGLVANREILRYLNRLSSLLFVVAVYEDQAPTLAKKT